MPDEIRDLTNICKRCNNSVTTGLRCKKCGIMSHRSCLKAIKAKFYDDSTVDCCLNLSTPSNTTTVDISETTDITMDVGKSVEQIKIAYLEEINRQKDLVITNQAMLIESLQVQIKLLNRDILAQPENCMNVNVPSTSKSSCYAQGSNENNKSLKKKAKVEQQISPQFAPSEVSRAIHTAHTSKVCHELINLTSDPPEKTQKTQKNSRKLLVGNADSDGEKSTFKSAKITQMKHFHITKCAPETTKEDLIGHLRNIVPMVQVEPLKSRHPVQYSSFKISIPTLEAPNIMKAELWPSGVVVNNFFRAKSQSKPNAKVT